MYTHSFFLLVFQHNAINAVFFLKIRDYIQVTLCVFIAVDLVR